MVKKSANETEKRKTRVARFAVLLMKFSNFLFKVKDLLLINHCHYHHQLLMFIDGIFLFNCHWGIRIGANLIIVVRLSSLEERCLLMKFSHCIMVPWVIPVTDNVVRRSSSIERWKFYQFVGLMEIGKFIDERKFRLLVKFFSLTWGGGVVRQINQVILFVIRYHLFRRDLLSSYQTPCFCLINVNVIYPQEFSHTVQHFWPGSIYHTVYQ